jgi:hypothetical protein
MNRAEQAQRILSDPLVVEAFATLERDCVEEWRRAPARDVEGRERLWLMLKLVEKLRQHFAGLVETGQLASRRIAELEKERRLNLFG